MDRPGPRAVCGVVLWLVTVLINRASGQKPAEPTLETVGTSGPVN